MSNDSNKRNERAKDALSNFWKTTSDISRKAVDSAKELAEQTKKTIYEAQAKKYTPITADDVKSESFDMPCIISIVDNSANRKFITDKNAIGWIEQYEGVDVLRIYDTAINQLDVIFVPVPQRDNVYCKDNFDSKKYTDVSYIFSKAAEEKIAELSNIAYSLGAKSCSVEIVEAESAESSKAFQSAIVDLGDVSKTTKSLKSNAQSGKRVSLFEGHDNPKIPTLKWFAHDENIKSLIEMRLNKAVKSTSLKLEGSSSAVISKRLACAVDGVMNVKGGLSMESSAMKEHNEVLVFDIDF